MPLLQAGRVLLRRPEQGVRRRRQDPGPLPPGRPDRPQRGRAGLAGRRRDPGLRRGRRPGPVHRLPRPDLQEPAPGDHLHLRQRRQHAQPRRPSPDLRSATFDACARNGKYAQWVKDNYTWLSKKLGGRSARRTSTSTALLHAQGPDASSPAPQQTADYRAALDAADRQAGLIACAFATAPAAALCRSGDTGNGGLKVPEGFAATRATSSAFPGRHRIGCGARARARQAQRALTPDGIRTGLLTTMSQANRVGKQNARERVSAEKIARQRAERQPQAVDDRRRRRSVSSRWPPVSASPSLAAKHNSSPYVAPVAAVVDPQAKSDKATPASTSAPTTRR